MKQPQRANHRVITLLQVLCVVGPQRWQRTPATGRHMRLKDAVLRSTLLLLVAALPVTALQAAEPAAAGSIIYIRGALSSQTSSGALRIVGEQSPIAVGDVLKTAVDSFAVVQLADGSRVMMRPDTAVSVKALGGGEALATLELQQGGISAVAVETIAPPTPALRLVTPDGVVDTTGGEFIARLCDVDCALEANTVEVAATAPSTAVARAVVVGGAVGKTTPEGQRSSVLRGTPFGVGDVVVTEARGYAVLAFTDGTRVTVQPESTFEIEAYRLSPETPAEEESRVRLRSGGMRASSGGIARRTAANALFATPQAVMGIRGTGFDLVETPACGGKAAPPGRKSLTASVWNGTIVVTETGVAVSAGETVCVVELGGEVIPIPERPQLNTPRPDEVDVPENAFAAVQQNGTEAGLQLSVIDGAVTIRSAGSEVGLGAGDDAFAGAGLTGRVLNAQAITRADPFFTLNLSSTPSNWSAFEPTFGVMCPQ